MYMHYIRNRQELMNAEARVNRTTVDSHRTEAKFRRLHSAFIWREEHPLWYIYTHIHELSHACDKRGLDTSTRIGLKCLKWRYFSFFSTLNTCTVFLHTT